MDFHFFLQATNAVSFVPVTNIGYYYPLFFFLQATSGLLRPTVCDFTLDGYDIPKSPYNIQCGDLHVFEYTDTCTN